MRYSLTVRIYFARHGESEANVLREFSNRGHKHGLTAKGRDQAVSLAGKLADAGVDRVIASPLLRALESARIVASILGVTPEESDALREWDVGVLEGRCDDEAWAAYWQLRKEWAAGRHGSRIEGGESLIDVTNRFVPFVRRVVAEAKAGGHVLLIAHGGLYCAALPAVLENIDREFSERNGIDNASFVVAEDVQGALLCREWAGIGVDQVRA